MTTTRGFTLIELLIVMAIIATVASFGMIRFVGAQAGSRDTRRQSDIKQYQSALEIYALKNNGKYPPIAAGVVTGLCDGGYLVSTTCPTDPRATIAADDYWYAPNDPAAPGAYVLWATLEKTPLYFVICSSGLVGTTPTGAPPTSGVCPL
jgi:prepilin-type N-terminal cleavage/methylation domain-containing protein